MWEIKKFDFNKVKKTTGPRDPIMQFWKRVWETAWPDAKDASDVWISEKDWEPIRKALVQYIAKHKAYAHLTEHSRMVMIGMHILNYAPATHKELEPGFVYREKNKAKRRKKK